MNSMETIRSVEAAMDEESIARRRFLKRAITVAWSTPLIYSVMTTPAFAATCPGGSCSASNACTTGCCCCGVSGSCAGADATQCANKGHSGKCCKRTNAAPTNATECCQGALQQNGTCK